MNETRIGTRWFLGALAAGLALFGLPHVAAAQVDVLGIPLAEPSAALEPGPQPWGTAAQVVYTVGAFEFDNFGSLRPSSGTGGSRFCTAACELVANVSLPAGAQVLSIQVDGCDTDGTQNLFVALARRGTNESSFTLLTSGSTTGTPGCAPFNLTLPAPHTIDNANNSYFLDVQMAGPGNTTRFTSVRVNYRLQVSPAPATATFPNDVPTSHPFFRFVEALAAAGITGGCSAGSYCPNNPVSRGEMAVFLSTALGLHFPN